MKRHKTGHLSMSVCVHFFFLGGRVRVRVGGSGVLFLYRSGRQYYKLIWEKQNELWAGKVFPLGIMQDKAGPDIRILLLFVLYFCLFLDYDSQT